MIKIHTLKPTDYQSCYRLLQNDNDEANYFKSLGWTIEQFKNDFLKASFSGHGIFENKILVGFIIGNIITIKNLIEYEILLIYIKKEKRKIGYASKLLDKIELLLNKKLQKIYLEVAHNNNNAIKLYIKKGFNKLGIRKKYYSINNNKFDALLFEKKFND